MPLPKGARALPYKWVFKVKTKRDGENIVVRYKARCVARGDYQRQGTDYNEYYSPTVNMDTIRAVLAEGFARSMSIECFDFSTAYLNAEIDREFYMKQIPGYELRDKNGRLLRGPNGELLVQRLLKSPYGLVQSGRRWYFTLANHLKDNGFKHSWKDRCLFVKKTEEGKTAILLVFVDDLILLTDSEELRLQTKKMLSDRFKMQDFGTLSHILGIDVQRETHTQPS